MKDPFEHFGEQQQSYELIQQHGEFLAREAAELVREHAGLEPVGVIMEADAAEAEGFRRVLFEKTGQQVPGFVGVMPRSLVVEILRANAPQMLEFLVPPTNGSRPRLPVVVATKNGFRLAAIGYDAPE